MTSRSAQIRFAFMQYASRLACVLACALACLAICVPTASAEVRSTDIICGQTVAQRGFTSSLCPGVEANHAMLIDEDGKIYFERDAHSATKIASVTKVMTAIVAMEYNPALDATITVTEEAAEVGESTANLQEGDTLTLKNALTAMMVASGNDAAESIAASLGAQMLSDDGSSSSSEEACVARFVQAMNDKATEMGLEDTLFTNPHGLDDGDNEGDQHSTASDVAAEVMLAMQNEDFRSIVGSATAKVQLTRNGEKTKIELTSTDELLTSYDGTVGVKTGFTDLAGACFAGANDHDGKEYYAIVLDSPDEAQRFTDTSTLWDWCYNYLIEYQLVNTPDTAEVTTEDGSTDTTPVLAYVAHSDWMDVSVPATVANPDEAMKIFTLDGNVSQEMTVEDLRGYVNAGDKVGTITFKQHNEVIATIDLVAAQDVAGPNPIEAVSIWWQRLTGNNTVAQSVLVNESMLVIDKTAV